MSSERWPVLVTRRLPQPALERIGSMSAMTLYEGVGAMPRDQLLAEIKGKLGAVMLLTDRVDDEFLDAAGDQLVIVANFAVGFDNIDVPACTRRGILCSNTPMSSPRPPPIPRGPCSWPRRDGLRRATDSSAAANPGSGAR